MEKQKSENVYLQRGRNVERRFAFVGCTNFNFFSLGQFFRFGSGDTLLADNAAKLLELLEERQSSGPLKSTAMDSGKNLFFDRLDANLFHKVEPIFAFLATKPLDNFNCGKVLGLKDVIPVVDLAAELFDLSVHLSARLFSLDLPRSRRRVFTRCSTLIDGGSDASGRVDGKCCWASFEEADFGLGEIGYVDSLHKR